MTWAQWGFQDALSPLIEEFLYFHDFLVIVLSFIFRSTIWVMLKRITRARVGSSLVSYNSAECLWTIYPAVILFQIRVPSVALLFILDETAALSQVSIKAAGHQWYWSYEYRDGSTSSPLVDYRSYILPQLRLAYGGARLLDVDNRTSLPYGVVVGVIMSPVGILHPWTLPSLGAKITLSPEPLTLFINKRPLSTTDVSRDLGQNSPPSKDPCRIQHALLKWAAAAKEKNKQNSQPEPRATPPHLPLKVKESSPRPYDVIVDLWAAAIFAPAPPG